MLKFCILVAVVQTEYLTYQTRYNLNLFLRDQYQLGVIDQPVRVNGDFGKTGVIALQKFLMKKGRLPVNTSFNSLLIGTLQRYLYDLGIYPDIKPCGVFGPDTRQSLKTFLAWQTFYKTSKLRLNPRSTRFDSTSVKLLQEFLSSEDGGYIYRSKIDGRWNSETIKSLRTFLYEVKAPIGFTRDYNKRYHYEKGVWGYKTSIVLQQYLVDHGFHLAHVDGRFNSKSVWAFNGFLEKYARKRNLNKNSRPAP